MIPGRGRLARLAAPALVIALAAGCGAGRYSGVLPANQRPEVLLTQAPASTTQPYFYAYEFRWAGFDADGVVDHFLYCIDPPTHADADTPWVKTTQNRGVFLFRSDQVDSVTANAGHGFHSFVVKSVDNGGLASAPVARAFNSYTVAPTVRLVNPLPNHLFPPTFGSSIRLSWTGTDPDGRTRTTPVKYKYRVFSDDNLEFDFVTMLVDPDSLRRRYAPGFSRWDSLGGDTTSVTLHQLIPGKRYVFVLIAIDEVGAYSPLLTFDTNMLFFYVSGAANLGPALTIYNETFYYAFTSGSFSLDPSTFIQVELPADQPLSFHWSGKTSNGSFVAGYRWKLDGDLGDETPRSNEFTDLQHWSRYSPSTLGCVLPPIVPPAGTFGETHFLYIEAEDGEGQVSLGVVKFTAVRAAFDRGLLFVDDTRLSPDKLLANGTLDRPRGVWPTAAELDTFFFARGGFPWRTYPAGTVSPAGVFLGYEYDTLGTRFQPSGLVTLSQLGRYRWIVWYTDAKAATYINSADSPRDPMSTLHALSFPGMANPLASWVRQGGKLWLFGGGVATSMQREWEKPGSSAAFFSNADGELVPGRFMYDLAHWQSEIQIGNSTQAAKPDTPPAVWPGSPDYARLPVQLFGKSEATDPFAVYAPNRTSASDFFQIQYSGEAVSKPNTILQDIDPDPDVISIGAALDTLYMTAGGALGAGKPSMTYYHGTDQSPLVFSGFPLWYFRRDDVIAVADFVLQDLWGLPRQAVPRGAGARRAPAPAALRQR